MENVINWADAFKDEGFIRELRKNFEIIFQEHEISEEEFDDAIDEIFKYDELNESITFNKEAFKKIGIKHSADSNDADDTELTEEYIDNANKNLRMLLLLLLMKDNGLKIDKNNMKSDKSKSVKHKNHGNGARAAEFMSLITGIPLQSCKNFITNPAISLENIKDLVTKINFKLDSMGMRIRI